MAIGDDFSISSNGDIRYTGTSDNYTVIAFHRWLGDLMDDAQASGNDLLDITSATASERATDNQITLNSPYNIDDVAAQHLYDGSVIQDGGNIIYDGMQVLAAPGTDLQMIQNGAPITPNFWGTGLNPDATQGISHRFLVKVRTGGSDIDGRRLIGQTRKTGKTFSEWRINGTSRGNNVLALSYADDLNNTTIDSTVKGWTSITNQEGTRLIDVNNDGLSEFYYSEWNKDSFTINQLYERTKWLSRTSTTEDSGAGSGADFTVGDGTIVAQGQSFSVGVVPAYLTRVKFRLKKTGSPTGNLTATVYAHTGTFGSSGTPTGAALATSVNVDVSKLTTSYADVEIGFLTPALLSASTNYFVAAEYTGGDGSNNVQVEGSSTSSHAGNRAEDTGSWAASATSDLWFDAFTSPQLYGIPGERFRGPTNEVVVDTPSGAVPTGGFTQPEPVSWPSGTGQLLAVEFDDTTAIQIDVNATAGTFTRLSGSYITDRFRPGQTIVTSGFTNGGNNTTKIIQSVTALVITVTNNSGLVNETGGGDERIRAGHMWIQLLTGVVPTDDQTITGTTSSATCLVNVTVTDRTNILKSPFLGQSTGSAIIGSYGVGVESSDLSANDKVFDLTNAQLTPPNNVIGTVGGLVIGEDYVLVGPADGGVLDTDQLTLNTSLSGATETAVVVTASIPTDTPSSGTIRVQLDSGIYRLVTYSSFSGSTFVIPSTDFSGGNSATAPRNVFISYIDKLATSTSETFTYVFNSNRSHFARVRDGGGTPIKTFEGTFTVGSAGGAITAIRTSDT